MPHNSTLTKIIALLVLLACQISVSNAQQPGTIDNSFGKKGRKSFDFAEIGFSTGYYDPIALQSDGKMIVVTSRVYGVYYQKEFVISRFNVDGSLDSSFGMDGITTIVFDTTGRGYIQADYVATCVLVFPDNKILVGGFSDVASYTFADFCLARLHPDGQLDSSFGIFGKRMDRFGNKGTYSQLVSMALQQDGKILAAGNSNGYCVARYTPNGFPDSTFGKRGVVNNTIDNWYGPTFVGLQADKIITGTCFGQETDSVYTISIRVQRLLANGKIDKTFGQAGHASVIFDTSENYLQTIAVLSDESILVGGSASNSAAIAKFKKDGTIDSAFGTNGKFKSQFKKLAYNVTKIIEQPDGKLIAFAQTYMNKYLVFRLLANGMLDSTFGQSGRCLFDLNAADNTLYSGILQNDGKIIALGRPGISFTRIFGYDPIRVSFKEDIMFKEENSGNNSAVFKVILDRPAPFDVSVAYSTKEITATEQEDFIPNEGVIKISAGHTSSRLPVKIIGDNQIEKNEHFLMLISKPVNAMLGDKDSAICLIKNDDTAIVSISNAMNMEKKLSGITIFPNPVRDILNIQFSRPSDTTDLYIFNSTGKLVLQKRLTQGYNKINLVHLSPGSYNLDIISKHGKSKFTILKL